MKKRILVIIALLAAGISSANAQEIAVILNDTSGWYKIAETDVDFSKDSDEVVVLGKDHFRKIMLKVTDAPIEMNFIIVYYEKFCAPEKVIKDCAPQKIIIQQVLNKDDKTKIMDLEGVSQAISKIGLNYKTIKKPEKLHSHVEIWGLK